MANDNRVSAILADQDAAGILEGVRAIRAKLPFLVTLSPQERRLLAKMGDKSIGFDEKCSTFMQSNPEFLPGFLNPEKLAKDRILRQQILRFVVELDGLAQEVDDTLMALSSELWRADLAYYQNVRVASRVDRPNAKLIFEELRCRFPGPSGLRASMNAKLDPQLPKAA